MRAVRASRQAVRAPQWIATPGAAIVPHASSGREAELTIQKVLFIAGVMLLAGCGATEVGSTKQGIWFREPFVGTGDMAGQAERHCAKFGKTASYAGTLDPTKGFSLPVVAYNCQ